MEPSSNDQFYSRLPVNEIPLSDLLTEEHLFYKVPDNWQVVVADIKNSTGAVSNGLHETVNLIATGCIVAVLNIAYRFNITVPFFFGGDGATFIIPSSLFDDVMKALLMHQENTRSSFKIDLRVGHVSVKEIYEHEHALNISKLRTARQFAIPVLLGDGLTYAESKVKGVDYILDKLGLTSGELDLSGMSCRWDRVKPPENSFEVVSLLVIAKQSSVQQKEADIVSPIQSGANDVLRNQATIFKKAIQIIDAIYGDPQNRKPISVAKLKVKATLARLNMEMHVRTGGFHPFYLMSKSLVALFARLYFKTKKGKVYLNELVDMSDTLVIDGKINTVITGTAQQRERLVEALGKMESDGEILYGLFVSSESVMSCYVRSLNEKHIHFVDGAEGGYTKAANVVKQKYGIKRAAY